MAVTVKTFVTRIALSPPSNLEKRIKDECESQASGNQGRRLVATFTVGSELVLIFQLAPDNQPS